MPRLRPAPTPFGLPPERLWAPHVALVDADVQPDGVHRRGGWTLTIRTVQGVQVQLWTNPVTESLTRQILGTTVRELTRDSCPLLWGGRVVQPGGSQDAFLRCRAWRTRVSGG